MEEHKSDMSAAAGAASAAASSASAAVPVAASRPRAQEPAAKKKIVIRAFKVAPKPPPAFSDDTLNNLSTAVEAVYTQTHSRLSQEELYRSVEALCNLGQGAEVYSRLARQCETHISGVIRKMAEQVNREEQEHAGMQLGSPHAGSAAAASPASPTAASSSSLSLPLLQSLQTIWTAHCQEMLIIRGIFLFLDRTYVMQQATAHATVHNNNPGNGNGNGNGSGNSSGRDAKKPPASLWEMGLNFFCEQLQQHPHVESKLISGLLTLVEKERLGESINRGLLKSLLRMLSALRLYSTHFQPVFLSATAAFYAAASRKAIASELSVSDYVYYIQRTLVAEEERAIAYLDESTRYPLAQSLEQELIAAHADHMLGSTLTQLLDAKRSAELGIMYTLFGRIRQHDVMRAAFESYVKQTAERMVRSGSMTPEDSKKAEEKAAADASSAATSGTAPAPSPPPSLPPSTPATLIVDLLRLKVTLDEVLTFSFHDDPDFVKSVKTSFEHALNCVEQTPAEMLAKFIDRVLRTGGKGIKITPFNGTGVGVVAAIGMEDENAAIGAPSLSLAPAAAAAASAATVGSEEVEGLLEKTMFLFRYMHNKDIFQGTQ
jgi:cullin-4